ncbi:MAG: YCF48-related protein [Candidatus Acidiferrales bacterium]
MIHLKRHKFQLFILLLFLPLFALADSPQSWRLAQLPHHLVDIAASGNAFWACGADEMIAKSTDGGQSWELKHENASGSVLIYLGFANEQLGYAVGTRGMLLVTTDGGKRWKALRAGKEPIYAVAFADEQHGLIHTRSAVELTTDGGATWIPIPALTSDPDLAKFKFVLNLAALDANHMAVLLKEGPADYYDQRILLTQDGGMTFKTVNVPDVGLSALVTHGGEFWTFGVEVIEKQKKGGGYCVPLVMHSKDAEHWEHSPRLEQELGSCASDGCLLWDGVGVDLYGQKPSYWVFPADRTITTKWAMVGDTLCAVSGDLHCTTVSRSDTIPKRSENAAVPPTITPPALGAPTNTAPVCISCPYDRIVVSDTASGPSEIEIQLLIATDGTVSDVNVTKAPTPEIRARFAQAARSWIFEPYISDGAAAAVRLTTRYTVMVIKSP